MPIDRVRPYESIDTCPVKMRKDMAELELIFVQKFGVKTENSPYLRHFKDDFDVLWYTHCPFPTTLEYVI